MEFSRSRPRRAMPTGNTHEWTAGGVPRESAMASPLVASEACDVPGRKSAHRNAIEHMVASWLMLWIPTAIFRF